MLTLETIIEQSSEAKGFIGKAENPGFFRRKINRINDYLRKGLTYSAVLAIGLINAAQSNAQEFYLGPGGNVSVAMSNGGNIIVSRRTQNNILTQKFNKHGEEIGDIIEFYGLTPDVAMDKDENFVITWMERSDLVEPFMIYAQRYDKDSNSLGDKFQVNLNTDYFQEVPVVAMNNEGRFAICWKHFIFDDDPENAFYAQIFDKDGNKVGCNFKVSDYLGGLENPAAIAMAENGDFVITWDSRREPMSDNDIFAQRYDKDGNELGDRITVNSQLDSYQWDPRIAMDNEGNFIIAWYSWEQDGSRGGIYAQRFDENGNKLGEEFQVNSHTQDNQYSPDIAMNRSTNDFVIAWQSWDQDGDYGGIYAQRYNNQGSKIGGEFRVNTITEGSQGEPRIAMNNIGDFVTAWTCGGAYAKILPFYNPADVNKDGYVNNGDMAVLAGNWLKDGPE